MRPILCKTLGWEALKAIGLSGTVILALLLGQGAVLADSTNFSGDFAAAFWTNQVQFGSVAFSNSNTELVLNGPNFPTAEKTSVDGILYNGTLGGGLAVGGTVQFNWLYNSGDALSSSEADFAVQPPGGGSPIVNLLAQGGPGVITSGLFTSTPLAAGTTFEFLLSTDTLANKLSGSLIISDFQFHADIPEPSTRALLATVLISFGAARWQRSRRR